MREKPETVRFYQMRLPHWEVVRGRYFVTIRLKGSIPDEGLQRIRVLADQAADAVAIGFDGAKERHRALMEMERWLHAAPRVRYLANPRIAEAVEEAIRHREEQGTWTMFSHVIMPNHIHLFFRLGPKDEPGPVDPLHRRLVEPATTHQPPYQPGSRAVDERAVFPSQTEQPCQPGSRAVDPLHRRLVEPATTHQPPYQAGSRAVDERAGFPSQTEHPGQTGSRAVDPLHCRLVEPATTHQPPYQPGSRAVDERAVFPSQTEQPCQPGSRAVDERAGPSTSDDETAWYRQKLRLDRVIVSFKRWTATQAAEISGLDSSRFWQREWFDHWSRSLEEDEAIERYIRQNSTCPVHAL